MTSPDQFDPKVSFGVRLKQLRIAAGFTQEALAHLSGLDRTYISSCERGKRNASLEALHKLAAALNIPAASLLEPIGSVRKLSKDGGAA